MLRNIKVTIREVNFKYLAPAIWVESTSKEDAVKVARQMSGLSRFENWEFIAF